jgi:hypothetical protein
MESRGQLALLHDLAMIWILESDTRLLVPVQNPKTQLHISQHLHLSYVQTLGLCSPFRGPKLIQSTKSSIGG